MASEQESSLNTTPKPLAYHRITVHESVYVLNISRLMFILSGFMLLMIYSNIIVACATTFACDSFLPSLVYLGCFRGYDRVFIVACTFYSTVVFLAYIGGYYHFKNVAGDAEREAMLSLGIVSAVSLPLLALTDEVNAIHSFPIEVLNKCLCMLFVFSTVTWVVLGLNCLKKLSISFNSRERAWYKRLKGLCYLLVLLIVLMLFEIKYAEAFCEWLIITIGVMLPPAFSQFYRGFNLVFSVENRQERLEA